jgi:hypothetical protein
MENYTPYSSRLGAAWWQRHCHLALGKSERITLHRASFKIIAL